MPDEQPPQGDDLHPPPAPGVPDPPMSVQGFGRAMREGVPTPNLPLPTVPPTPSGSFVLVQLPSDEELPEAAASVPDPPRVAPGDSRPGFWQGLGWCALMVLAGIPVVLVLIVLEGGRPPTNSPLLLPLGLAATFAYNCLVPRLRLGQPWRRRTALVYPSVGHVLAALLAGPCVLIAGASLGAAIVDCYGLAGVPKEALSMKEVTELLKLPGDLLGNLMTVVLAAVLPAVGEELLFRGYLGRGLVSRYGAVRGVLLTSLLFAVAHLHPVQSPVVFFMGVAMHVAYLAGRSLWVPIALHFAINSSGVALSNLSADGPDALDWANVGYGAAGFALALFALALMVRSARTWRLPNGSAWTPGYLTAEAPPATLECVAEQPPASGGSLLALFGAAGLLVWASIQG